MLREVTVKIRLEKIHIQKEVIVEILLDNKAIELVRAGHNNFGIC